MANSFSHEDEDTNASWVYFGSVRKKFTEMISLQAWQERKDKKYDNNTQNYIPLS